MYTYLRSTLQDVPAQQVLLWTTSGLAMKVLRLLSHKGLAINKFQ